MTPPAEAAKPMPPNVDQRPSADVRSVPVLTHQTALEVVVRLGSVAQIETATDGDFPIVQIAWGTITVLVMPHSAADNQPLARCDVDRAHDLVSAALVYRDAMDQLWNSQQTAAPD
jgi:hypothetical protein